MNCECLICDYCHGSGMVWVSKIGEYLGNHPCDDTDELETCPFCDGTGITAVCYECTLSEIECEDEEN